MRLEKIIRYGIDGKEFSTQKQAVDYIEDEAAAILNDCLNMHDGRHKNKVKAIESILTDKARRKRLAELLVADFSLDDNDDSDD